MSNIDPKTVEGFGREWVEFDQSNVDADELRSIFEEYFEIFPWEALPQGAVGFDAGCGSGRWARLVAPRVGELHCIDASAEALEVARRNLSQLDNCRFVLASVDAMPLEDGSTDFGYSLGVLHHIPDTQAGLLACVRKLKPGAPFLLYLYYACENRPAWYRAAWKVSDLGRRLICRLPHRAKVVVSTAIAGVVYFPLARTARGLERLGFDVRHLPLSVYRDRGFYSMRTDALDRFGTRLEQRFTREQVEALMRGAGLERLVFSRRLYWCAVGFKSGAA